MWRLAQTCAPNPNIKYPQMNGSAGFASVCRDPWAPWGLWAHGPLREAAVAAEPRCLCDPRGGRALRPSPGSATEIVACSCSSAPFAKCYGSHYRCNPTWLSQASHTDNGITVNCRERRPRSDFPDFSGFFGRFSAPGGVRGHPVAGGFHHRRREPVATLPDPVRGRNRVFGAFRDISIPCIGDEETPMLLLHTSTGLIVLLYDSNSPCGAATGLVFWPHRPCLAVTQSLCCLH